MSEKKKNQETLYILALLGAVAGVVARNIWTKVGDKLKKV